MSKREKRMQAYQAKVAKRRAAAARAWDEGGIPGGDKPVERNGADLLGGDDDLLGEAIIEALGPEGPRIGPIEFEGKEDYIRGATDCLHGCDIVGLAPQWGSREGYNLLGATPVSSAVKSTAVRQTTAPASVAQGRTQFQVAKSPGGRTVTVAKLPKTGKKPTHKVTVENAKQAAKRAEDVAKAIDVRVTKESKKPGVHGLIGAAALRGTTKPKITLAQARKLADGLRDAAKITSAAATKHDSVVTTAKAKSEAGIKQLKAGKSGIHGLIGGGPFDDVGDCSYDDLLGAEAQIFGELLESMVIGATPDAGNPGYNTDGSRIPSQPGDTPDGNGWMQPSGAFDTDPKFGAIPPFGGGGIAMPSSGSQQQQLYSSGRVPGPDEGYGMEPAPTFQTAKDEFLTAVTYEPGPTGEQEAEMVKRRTSLPMGAVVYDGTGRTFGDREVGSYSYFFKKQSDGGVVEPKNGGMGQDNGGGIFWNSGGWWQYWPAADDLGAKTNTWSWTTPMANDKTIHFSWGPLIGRPGGTFNNMHYDEGSQRFFWYRDQVPDIFKDSEVQVLFNQMLTDWVTRQTIAKANYAEQVTADFNDAKAANEITKRRIIEDSEIARQNTLTADRVAKEDAERARADADTANKLAQQQAAADEASFQRQSQMDQQYQQQQMQMQSQQQQMQLQSQQAEQQAYSAWLQSPEAHQTQVEQQPQAQGPFDDVSNQEPNFGDGRPYNQSEQELLSNASQRPEFDGDWS